ncbi:MULTISPECIES: sugar ABC transporter ATP-binding protein [unclassified Rhodococcus (in: high G+C Gram-positive bacteria)]|uniref:sugar ABC transporter ATP-binding protein n=1 Tax=unclassified Rhodococcus (in: high G+C Gram-positive bacteria) TaxID=192944 RepID=UPI00211AA717|nr:MULTISPECIES: sugar ABC transporter ATP-binding protein [unclassified Rhodococcus (in: high G+C Gram-positive bacteria)]
MGSSSSGIALELCGVSRRFGSTVALDRVDLTVEVGTVHGLVGENGAGKSTALGIAAGRISATAGDARIFGTRLRQGRPHFARELGLVAIYQELTIVPALSVLENVFLGVTPSVGGVLSRREMTRRFSQICRRMKVSLPAGKPAGSLSLAQQQMIEIMRALAAEARIVLFDEPTSSLAEKEREAFYSLVSDLRSDGVTVVIVTHNLDEVLDICDHVTVFRDGRLVSSAPISRWTKGSLVGAMVGDDDAGALTNLRSAPLRVDSSATRAIVAHAIVSIPGRLVDVELDVRAGEIVGVVGLVGSGRSSLLRSLAGLESAATGSLSIDGRERTLPTNPRAAIAEGIGYIPEDRKSQGLILGMRASDNIVLSDLRAQSRWGLVRDRGVLAAARSASRGIAFSPQRLRDHASVLSGGNQQKLLVARWVHCQPRLLLADEPTRGVDIGARVDILRSIGAMADGGRSVVLVSSELEEILALSDRVVVLSRGRVVATYDNNAELTREKILRSAFQVEFPSAESSETV